MKKYSLSDPEAINRIHKSLYADDLVTDAEDSTKELNLYETAKQSMKDGGLNLRKWKCNDVFFSARIQEKENGDKQLLPNPLIQMASKILGLSWNQDKDTIIVQLIEEEKEG